MEEEYYELISSDKHWDEITYSVNSDIEPFTESEIKRIRSFIGSSVKKVDNLLEVSFIRNSDSINKTARTKIPENRKVDTRIRKYFPSRKVELLTMGFYITKLLDEYYLLRIITPMADQIVDYRCDQLDGLMACIEEKALDLVKFNPSR